MKDQKQPSLAAFQAGRLKSPLIGFPGDVKGACYVLNMRGPIELCGEFRRLVQVWKKSGPNLKKMFNEDKGLEARTKHGRTLLIPTGTGRGYLCWLPNPPKLNVASPKDGALTLFMDLIVNPDWQKLGGPCLRCGKYFVKNTIRQNSYCSRRCSSIYTARLTTIQKRKEEREHKLRVSQQGIAEWSKIRRRIPWKRWVSDRTKIDQKWLTRAINAGALIGPHR